MPAPAAAHISNARVLVADVHSTGLPDASVDRVHTDHVLQHVVDPAVVLLEAGRILSHFRNRATSAVSGSGAEVSGYCESFPPPEPWAKRLSLPTSIRFRCPGDDGGERQPPRPGRPR